LGFLRGGGRVPWFFALKRGTFEKEGESDRGELQKARSRKESLAAEKNDGEWATEETNGGERTTEEMTGGERAT
jgi:hypothetical protein